MLSRSNHLYSGAIGGVKLQVQRKDLDAAYRILVESGYIQERIHKPNKILMKLDSFTSHWPFVGRLGVELRLLITIAIVLTIVVVTIVLMSLP